MTPQQVATITACHIQGIPQGEIASRIGVTRETVNRNLQKPEIRSLIEREATELLNRGLKTARQTITRAAAKGNRKDADKDTIKLSLDAAKVILAAAGLSGVAPSTVITNLIQVNDFSMSHDLDGITGFLSSEWSRTTGISQAHTPPQCSTVCNSVIDVEPVQDAPPDAPNRVTNAPNADISQPVIDSPSQDSNDGA
jgi:DNA-binding Lrp family transcriptional regulator